MGLMSSRRRISDTKKKLAAAKKNQPAKESVAEKAPESKKGGRRGSF